MKKFTILLTLLALVSSCSVKEAPEFLRVENIRVLESTSKQITITADAFFNTPNIISGQLKTDGIKVFVNDNEMANISTETFKVPAQKEFSIPLKTSVATDSIFNTKNLGGLLNSFLNKKIKVQYKGQIKYKVLGFSHYYNLDETENLKIKL